jgi:glycosyltransferase involved in cell wall biosynthesis
MEVIFVDDGSEDETLSIIQEYISMMDIPAKIFHFSWRGLGVARNTVVENAEGKYIAWVDGDIIIPINNIKMQVEYMEKNSDVAIAGGSFGLLNQASLVAFLDNLVYVAYRFRSGEPTNLPGTGGAIYRVEAIKKIGGFDENIKGSGEDIDVAYRVKCAGWSVVRDKAIFYGRSKETSKELWRQYFWHGYGAHYVSHKNRGIISLQKMSPPVVFIVGIFYGILAYKAVRRKVSFLLPFHFTFANIAWWVGFLKSHWKGYGHRYRI